MRTSSLTLLILGGCVGGANLGAQRVVAELDAGPGWVGDAPPPSDLDASTVASADTDAGPLADAGLPLRVRVELPSDACGLCFDLTAELTGEPSADVFVWEDGSSMARRRVCPSGSPRAYTVRAREGAATVQLSPRASTCQADAGTDALLCLANRSFDRTPLLPASFGAAPWVACGALGTGMPQLLDGTAALPPLVPGNSDSSFLALADNDQISQQPCAPVGAGEPRSFRLELAALTTDVVGDATAPALEIWAGTALDCALTERLWTSPTLTREWTRHCVTLQASNALDSLTLRATSAGALPYPGRVFVDHLEPVASCP
jgi:hypothetical protein